MARTAENRRELLNIAEAAALLNVSKGTIRRWTNAGKLPCSRVGSRKERRFLEADLRKLLTIENSTHNLAIEDDAKASGRHRCVLCDNSSRGWDAIVAEIVSQNAQQAHVTFVGDSYRTANLADSLRESEIELQAEIKQGRIRVLSVEESYLLSGQFSGDRAAAFVESTILHAKSLGFDRSLFVGWSDWIDELEQLGREQLMQEVLDYERALDNMAKRYPLATILCPYASATLPSQALVELAPFHTEIQFQTQRVYGLAG